MKVLFAIIISTLSLAGTSYSQQIGFKDIDESQLSPWVPHIDLEYQGTYHFGDSELESSLVIVMTAEGSYAQIRSKTWSLKLNDWYYEFRNLDSVQIIDNRFFSAQTNGAFMIYSQDGQVIRTLKVDSPWSEIIEPGNYELGYRYGSLKRYYEGDYIQGSTQILTIKELEKLSFDQLTLLKNEIYARYGLIFNDRTLRKHFRQKEWYKEKYESVEGFLTQLEKNNIINIEIVESQTTRNN
ncbi:YARHG domain-containing protein [Fulvivirga maritima]|uniref:YARHG domain-containing protein n=1 Tax=Fulvivirga maritima TaxID=2904247 RepID=UPI001F3A69C6|nr:YARHG domain-containing protein [Fulvivirga maritima]UII27024.1 YARHG domain-containing protein [Fulvivirga maritima]